MLIATIVLFIFVSYAWYSSLEKSEPIIINTGSLRADCRFFKGIDSDYDGVLDEGSYEEITEAHLSFLMVIPGQIYTFKLSATNTGTTEGFLAINVGDIISDDEELLSYFSVYFTEPTERTVLLSEAEAGNLELFNLYVLEANQSFDFIFQIKVGNITEDKLHLKSLTISHFIVDLIQVHEE
jgi:hypothetical protein